MKPNLFLKKLLIALTMTATLLLTTNCPKPGEPNTSLMMLGLLTTVGMVDPISPPAPIGELGTVASNPITMSAPTAGTPSTTTGTMGSSNSYLYYKVPVTSGRGYTITLSDLTENLDLYTYSDSNYSSSVCSSSNSGAATDSCMGTGPTGGYFYIKISTSYYYSSSLSFTLTVSETQLSTASDTKAEMTAAPTVSSTVAAATTLNVTVPVDNDTGFVRVYIHQTANQTLINWKTPNNYRSVTPGNPQDVIVSVMVPRGLNNGTYQLVVQTAASQSDYNNGKFTVYSETPTGTANVYYKAFATYGTLGTFSPTNESSKRITVTSAASITPVSVACGTSGSPTAITLTSAPQAWSSATTSGTGSCYFVLTVPTNSGIYSVSLSGLSSDHDLFAYASSSFYTQEGASQTSSSTANEYISVEPDSYSYTINLKIQNFSGTISTWTLSSH
jgi:hypothetical protein